MKNHHIVLLFLFLVIIPFKGFSQNEIKKIEMGLSDDRRNVVRTNYSGSEILELYRRPSFVSSSGKMGAFNWNSDFNEYKDGNPQGLLIFELSFYGGFYYSSFIGQIEGDFGYQSSEGGHYFKGKEKIIFSENDKFLIHYCIGRSTITLADIDSGSVLFSLNGFEAFWISDREFIYSGLLLNEATNRFDTYVVRYMDIDGKYIDLYKSDSRNSLEVDEEKNILINDSIILKINDFSSKEKLFEYRKEPLLKLTDFSEYFTSDIDRLPVEGPYYQDDGTEYYQSGPCYHEDGKPYYLNGPYFYKGQEYYKYIPAFNDNFPETNGLLNESGVRIRSNPDLRGEQLAYLERNDFVKILDQTDEKMRIGDMDYYWYYIERDDHLKGWVYGAFINTIFSGGDGR